MARGLGREGGVRGNEAAAHIGSVGTSSDDDIDGLARKSRQESGSLGSVVVAFQALLTAFIRCLYTDM